jgi:uncharacterized secreted protein with C-terminal beta-propeller domain
MTELSDILSKLVASRQDQDEQLRFQNEMRNRMADYAKAHLRELESTGIAKLVLPDLSVVANGSVPGSLLNQFSLDEYTGEPPRRYDRRRSERMFFFGWGGGRETSANDVYVLDAGSDTRRRVARFGIGRTDLCHAVHG